jgi:hypothetical protein
MVCWQVPAVRIRFVGLCVRYKAFRDWIVFVADLEPYYWSTSHAVVCMAVNSFENTTWSALPYQCIVQGGGIPPRSAQSTAAADGVFVLVLPRTMSGSARVLIAALLHPVHRYVSRAKTLVRMLGSTKVLKRKSLNFCVH